MDTSYPVLAVTLATATAGYLYYRKKATTSLEHETILSKTEFRPFPLIYKEQLTHNTATYRFKLPEGRTLGLPIGQHIQILLEKEGKQILRSYTPVTRFDQEEHFELVVKTYPDGQMSNYLESLNIGDPIYIKGPKGAFNYTKNQYRSIAMLCGGTGIAPMYQLIQHILEDKKDKTEINLIYGNVSVDDILLKKELDDFLSKHKDRFKTHYLVDKLENEETKWTGGIGYINKETIKEWCPAPSEDIKILVCGPPLMVKNTCKLLEECGYQKPRTVSKMEDMVFKF